MSKIRKSGYVKDPKKWICQRSDKTDMSKIRKSGYVKDPWQTVGRKSEIEKKYKKIKQRFLPMVKLCH